MENAEKKQRKSPVRIVFRIIGILVAVIVVAVLAYVGYAYFSFHRIKDSQSLEIYQETKTKAVKTNREFVIASYNIGFGAYSDDYTFFLDGGKESRARSEDAVYQNIGGAMDTLAQIKPHFVLLQEVDFDSTRSHHVDERELTKDAIGKLGTFSYTFAQNYDSPFLMYPIFNPHGKNKSGLMTFSKAQITHALRKSLPIEDGLSKVIDLDRCYSKNTMDMENGKELVIYNFHLSAYTAKAETAEIQLGMVIQDMQKEYKKGNYCIAGGDFNRDLLGNSPEIFHTEKLEDNWAKPVNMELFTEGISLVAPFDENNLAASCRNPNTPYEKGDFVVTVDGFMVSANVQVTYANVYETNYKYSDHNPVVMKFKLKP